MFSCPYHACNWWTEYKPVVHQHQQNTNKLNSTNASKAQVLSYAITDLLPTIDQNNPSISWLYLFNSVKRTHNAVQDRVLFNCVEVSRCLLLTRLAQYLPLLLFCFDERQKILFLVCCHRKVNVTIKNNVMRWWCNDENCSSIPVNSGKQKMLKDKTQYSGLLQMFPQPHKCDVILNLIW